jgi:SNF2 family DNA or RNA helicase
MPPPGAKRPRDDESEASFTDNDDDDDDDDDVDDAPANLSDDEDDDDGGGGGSSRKLSVSERLKRIKSAFPVDSSRTLEWVLSRVGDIERRVTTATSATLQQPASLLCTLHGYQLDGLRWLAALYACGLNGILADEMGLGKTAQSIGLLAHLHASGASSGPFLVIAPLSTLSGWAEQLSTFCPSLSVLQYSGSADERAATRRALIAATGPPTVLLASYEPVLADALLLRSAVTWGYCVIDEAHRLKNRASALYRCLLDELGLGAVPRLLLTGTPMQNKADEFFNLLHFVAPSVYDDAHGFAEWLDEAATTASTATDAAAAAAAAGGGSGASGASDVAQKLWRPLMLRRRKAEHLALPPKREVTVRVPLTPMQRSWYKAVLEKNVAALGTAANARSLVNVLASLRKYA